MSRYFFKVIHFVIIKIVCLLNWHFNQICFVLYASIIHYNTNWCFTICFASLPNRAPRFRGFQQQDSQELLHYLLDAMQIEETKVIIFKTTMNSSLKEGNQIQFKKNHLHIIDAGNSLVTWDSCIPRKLSTSQIFCEVFYEFPIS